LTRAQDELEKLLDVVREVTEQLYTGTHTTREAATRKAVISDDRYGKKRVEKKKSANVLLALKHFMEDMSELTVSLDAFSEFAPEVASGHIKNLRSEIEVHAFPLFISTLAKVFY
jgi:isocitrate/isopropylmalate dehydrogenase